MNLFTTSINEQRQRYRFAYESDETILKNKSFMSQASENLFIYDEYEKGIVIINDIEFMKTVFDETINKFENHFKNEFDIKCMSNIERIEKELPMMNKQKNMHTK